MGMIAIWVMMAMGFVSATIALAWMWSVLVRERGCRRALESFVHGTDVRTKILERRVHVLEAREGAGGPLSSRRPLPPEPSQSGVRPRTTIGAPPEDETQVMTRAR